MSKAEDLLIQLRDHLASSLEGLKTCKIGLEIDITADAYPMVRLVPSRLSPDTVASRRRMELLVYFGQPADESGEGGLEAVYTQWLDMEEALIDACYKCPGMACIYEETITDEDRLSVYKMLALRITVRG